MRKRFKSENEEWVEISDGEGHTAALRHLAMIRDGSRIYHVLDAVSLKENEKEDGAGFLLVREDATADGAQEYVVANDESEIERVIASFIAHSLMLYYASKENEGSILTACNEFHAVGEFCICGIPELLQ